MKLRSCRQRPVCLSRSTFVLGKMWLFWLLMWHFMANGICFKCDASHHAVVNLLVLGAILVLPSCHSQECHCWSCTGKLPQLFFQAVFLIWPIRAHISALQGFCLMPPNPKKGRNFRVVRSLPDRFILEMSGGCLVLKTRESGPS